MELKRVYLGLFWKRFEVSERKLVKADPTKIVKALVATGQVCLDKRQKPVPMEQIFAHKSPNLRENIGIRDVGLREMGHIRTAIEKDYWEISRRAQERAGLTPIIPSYMQ